jgi:hypothetical protein
MKIYPNDENEIEPWNPEDEFLPITDSINMLLEDTVDVYTVPVRSWEVFILAGCTYFSRENIDVFGIPLPEIHLDRANYFREYIKSTASLTSERVFEMVIRANELLYLLLYHYSSSESLRIAVNYGSLDYTDMIFMSFSNRYLDWCEMNIEPCIFKSIWYHLEKDVKKREREGWMERMERSAEEIEQSYPGFKPAYSAFINSVFEINYMNGELWFFGFRTGRDSLDNHH